MVVLSEAPAEEEVVDGGRLHEKKLSSSLLVMVMVSAKGERCVGVSKKKTEFEKLCRPGEEKNT